MNAFVSAAAFVGSAAVAVTFTAIAVVLFTAHRKEHHTP